MKHSSCSEVPVFEKPLIHEKIPQLSPGEFLTKWILLSALSIAVVVCTGSCYVEIDGFEEKAETSSVHW